MVVYSAEAGDTAQDGVFTPTLLEYLEEPGMRFTDILRQTRRAVYEKTGGKQIPGTYDQLFNPIYLAGKASGSSAGSAASGSTRPKPSTASKTYSIGGTGPAGGIIFYDKGSYSDGWRYLEAAPASTEWYGKDWENFKEREIITGPDGTAVGTGKRNTEDIIAIQGRGNFSAAQLCAGLAYNGYSDWFLPSKDELDLMYKNLHKRGIGGFSDYSYWSSSGYNSKYAWLQRFSNGYQKYYNKPTDARVRAVRAF